MRPWRTIETAPRDGTFIIVGSKHQWARSARWVSTMDCWVARGGTRLPPVTHWIPFDPIPVEDQEPPKSWFPWRFKPRPAEPVVPRAPFETVEEWAARKNAIANAQFENLRNQCIRLKARVEWLQNQRVPLYSRIRELKTVLAETIKAQWLPNHIQNRVRFALHLSPVPRPVEGLDAARGDSWPTPMDRVWKKRAEMAAAQVQEQMERADKLAFEKKELQEKYDALVRVAKAATKKVCNGGLNYDDVEFGALRNESQWPGSEAELEDRERSQKLVRELRPDDLHTLQHACRTGSPFSFAGKTFVAINGDIHQQEKRIRESQEENRQLLERIDAYERRYGIDVVRREAQDLAQELAGRINREGHYSGMIQRLTKDRDVQKRRADENFDAFMRLHDRTKPLEQELLYLRRNIENYRTNLTSALEKIKNLTSADSVAVWRERSEELKGVISKQDNDIARLNREIEDNARRCKQHWDRLNGSEKRAAALFGANEKLRSSECENTALKEVIRRLDAKGVWQPIATAPKDGKAVLLYETKYDTVIGWWAAGHWNTLHGSCSSEFSHWMTVPDRPTPSKPLKRVAR